MNTSNNVMLNMIIRILKKIIAASFIANKPSDVAQNDFFTFLGGGELGCFVRPNSPNLPSFRDTTRWLRK